MSYIQPDPVCASDVRLQAQFGAMKFNRLHVASAEDIRRVIQKLLSLMTNERDDAYGNSARDRSRLLLKIAEGIRARTGPGFVMGIEIFSVECQEHGFTIDEAAYASYSRRRTFFLEFAEEIVPHVKQVKTLVTGGLRSVGDVVGVLHSGLDNPACAESRLPKDIFGDFDNRSIVTRGL
ncbi:NADH:flavin oxidoreductase/NADH oxidase [Colletotrichum musicola]|uniref:NADH:flavin oxidoreductase/NADH oxidase n=1 Tax=Colletotrichum musicola TaxID=2175873 RepID=A0A8H6IVM1_9PEZI|nr:NADH:flavin oxidoreductase/NADH oxidase [Colletotrichum musicola]